MSALQQRVDDFLAQRRIAVAGVSRTPEGGAANMIYKRFRDKGYQVYAVNPKADQVEGDRCYHQLSDIPDTVDGVVIVTRPEDTEKIVQDCDRLHIKRVWMHGGMHGPSTSVSPAAVEFCQSHQIDVIAGACPLMFGKTSDGGHRFMKTIFGLFGKLPR